MLRAIAIALLLPLAASAQDRSGADTASDWVATHFEPFGLWDSVCDERTEDGALRQRCWLRYVEVWSRDPFGASFVFLTPGSVEIGQERGVLTAPGGLRIERDGETIWEDGLLACRIGSCTFSGADAATFRAVASGGGTLVMDFRDPRGERRALRWDLARFGEAVDATDAAAAEWGLPGL